MMTFLLAAAFPLFTPINHISLPVSKENFDFIVMGDNRPIAHGLGPTLPFQEILKEATLIHPSFILSTGDLIFGYQDSIADYKTEAKGVLALVNQVPVPFFNVPGNHEICSKPEFQTLYTKLFSPMYGAFTFGGWEFIALSTDDAESTDKVSPAQMNSLLAELQGPAPKVVFEHRPVFAREGNDEAGATIGDPDKLHALFMANNVKAVMEGHDHVYNQQVHDGITYTIAGGSGAPLDAKAEEGGFYHFVLCSVKNGKLKTHVIPAWSLQVQQLSGAVILENYSHYDISMEGVTVTTSHPLKSFYGYKDKKGKTAAVDVTLISTSRVRGKYVSRFGITAVHHSAVYIVYR